MKRAALLILASLPLLLLAGYLWPHATLQEAPADESPWQWPASSLPETQHKLPARLSSFWPGSEPLSDAETSPSADASQQAEAQATWQLIGIIDQGKQLSALLSNTQGQIVTLQEGDTLDSQRQITELTPTRLHWRSLNGKSGVLHLFPKPTASPSSPTASSQENTP